MNSLYDDLKVNANSLETFSLPTKEMLTLTLESVVPFLNTFRWLVSCGKFTSNKSSCRREGNWQDDKNNITHVAFKDTYTLNKGAITFNQEFVDDLFLIHGSHPYFTAFDLDRKWTNNTLQKRPGIKVNCKSLWSYNSEKNIIMWKGIYKKDVDQNVINKNNSIDTFVWKRISDTYDIQSGTFVSKITDIA